MAKCLELVLTALKLSLSRHLIRIRSPLTLDEEIVALKVKIGRYQEKLNDPSKLVAGETRSEVVQMLYDARAYLTELIKQKTVTLQSHQQVSIDSQ
jgi:hypothetical protein